MSIAYDSEIVVSRYEHLHGRLVCYKKVGFSSGVKWERGSLFGEPSAPKKGTKADLDWAAGLGKLKATEVEQMGYCNTCRVMKGAIGSFCKKCKRKLV